MVDCRPMVRQNVMDVGERGRGDCLPHGRQKAESRYHLQRYAPGTYLLQLSPTP
jgi:hypothetical protein